ncbi:hypothetical protein H0H87_007775 [Tephrocybe sp. NHM501043]|nr:hypothetical protein H0H87_007775 [Tephrocybe sp. NHM501043]
MQFLNLPSILLSLLVALISYYKFYFIANMPTLRAVKAANAAFNPSYNPVALFVGGTSGIGQGLAEAFARHTKGNARIVIIGRNRAAADSIIAQFPKPTDSTTYTHEFVQCDVTRMKNIESVTKELLTRIPKINFLVMSPGIMTMKGRDETEEGIDTKLAVHYYARWKFIKNLLPALVKAKEAGEDAKVLSVLAAGMGGEINLDDLGLKKTFSLTNAALQAPTYNDLALQEFSTKYPSLTFVHSYPGTVRTSLMATSDSTFLKVASPIVLKLMYPFSSSYQESGEYMLHSLLGNKEGFFRMGSRGEHLGMNRYYGSEEARRKLWEHTVAATEVPLSS